MDGSKRDSGTGLGNYKIRFANAGQALGDARIKNRLYNWPIIVEGLKDRAALNALRFSGPIELLNRGWTLEKSVTHLYETYGTRNSFTGGSSICLLMDWDRTGGRLQSKLTRLMESFDMKIDTDLRRCLQKNLKPETRVVESLKGLSQVLLPFIDEVDFEK